MKRAEATLLMVRHFSERFTESILLIILVALGVGVASSAIALASRTWQWSRQILDVPEYREIVVGMRDEADAMQRAAIRSVSAVGSPLTTADLSIAKSIPAITHAYVEHRSMIHFINDASVRREASTPRCGKSDLANARNDSSIIIAEQEEAKGYEVTPQFFAARTLEAMLGSLFSDKACEEGAQVIVLGKNLAEELTRQSRNGAPPSLLIGKKLLTYEGYLTVIGILKEAGNRYDEIFFLPWQDKKVLPPPQLRFAVASPHQIEEACAQLSAWFSRSATEGIVCFNPRHAVEHLVKRNRGISLLILFLSFSGLFMSAVNVGNIFMGRGMRMREKFGILMALGASQKEVLRLLSVETLVITLSGALLSLTFSAPLSRSMLQAIGIEGASSVFPAYGTLVSWLFILAFSFIPAYQNAMVRPTDAMRVR
ncbi:ABC transporter permease [Sediminispirochaeta smaragdinae]|uniref:ABC3 transporter permease protein domain-containing protein n=1 Tax=Sediminispirochaeta smaragdinae (strain DSM 11293 / JCM 15392 / SEBR 4228) TaxID=573413 RepID=E1R2U3_SEDSS|nr:ABC transporter permease [Sediminispirochaeta smaragdinae]ADK80375.1 protein of unknown function DUF214 [Sediminispirochaeta smaragdinae DSM 11293]